MKETGSKTKQKATAYISTLKGPDMREIGFKISKMDRARRLGQMDQSLLELIKTV